MTVRHPCRDLHPGRHVNQAPFPGFPGAQRRWGRRRRRSYLHPATGGGRDHICASLRRGTRDKLAEKAPHPGIGAADRRAMAATGHVGGCQSRLRVPPLGRTRSVTRTRLPGADHEPRAVAGMPCPINRLPRRLTVGRSRAGSRTAGSVPIRTDSLPMALSQLPTTCTRNDHR